MQKGIGTGLIRVDYMERREVGVVDQPKEMLKEAEAWNSTSPDRLAVILRQIQREECE